MLFLFFHTIPRPLPYCISAASSFKPVTESEPSGCSSSHEYVHLLH